MEKNKTYKYLQLFYYGFWLSICLSTSVIITEIGFLPYYLTNNKNWLLLLFITTPLAIFISLKIYNNKITKNKFLQNP